MPLTFDSKFMPILEDIVEGPRDFALTQWLPSGRMHAKPISFITYRIDLTVPTTMTLWDHLREV